MTTEIQEVIKRHDRTDINNINELCDGMNAAIVTFIATKDGKLCRMVTVFDYRDVIYDHVPVAHDWIINNALRIKVMCWRHRLYDIKNRLLTKSRIRWETQTH